MTTMHQMKPLTERAIRCMFNVKYLSQPAMGKTKMVEQIVAEQKALDPEFYFKVFDGGTLQPTDLVMAMPNLEKRIIEMFRSGDLPNAYDNPTLRGIIYVGEIALMGIETERGFQKMWNHEDVGGFRIPAGVIFVGDGNRLSDKSGAQQGSRANGSRYVTHILDYDYDYALNIVLQNYHVKVGAFCKRNPACIDNYGSVFEAQPPLPANDPMAIEGKHGIWASLRSWQRVSDIMYDVENSGVPLMDGEIEANVGNGIAKTFHAFCTMLDHLSSLEEIVKNPKKITIPTKSDEQFALSTMLALLVQRDNWEEIACYIRRYPTEQQAVFFTDMNQRLKKEGEKSVNRSFIRSTKTFQTWITEPHIAAVMKGASSL